MMIKENGQSVSGHQWETVEPGENFNFEFYVKDPDGDNFTATMENKPDGATITNTGRTTSDGYTIYEFEWYPVIADIGWNNTISIVVTDTFGGILLEARC